MIVDIIKDKPVFYNTACLKVKSEYDYMIVFNELCEFASRVRQEKGCFEFRIVPTQIESREILLWEIWQSKEDMLSHMVQDHTKQILQKDMVENVWSKSATL